MLTMRAAFQGQGARYDAHDKLMASSVKEATLTYQTHGISQRSTTNPRLENF